MNGKKSMRPSGAIALKNVRTELMLLARANAGVPPGLQDFAEAVRIDARGVRINNLLAAQVLHRSCENLPFARRMRILQMPWPVRAPGCNIEGPVTAASGPTRARRNTKQAVLQAESNRVTSWRSWRTRGEARHIRQVRGLLGAQQLEFFQLQGAGAIAPGACK